MAPTSGPPGRERYVRKLTGLVVGVGLLLAMAAIAKAPAAQAAGPPTITDTDPDSPANQNNPFVKGTVGDSDPTQVRLYESPDCTGDPVATGTVADFTGAGIAVPVPDDAVTVLTALATDAAGANSTCSDPFAYTEDSAGPPAPQITDTAPPSPGNSNNPGVKGTAGADASQIELYKNSSCTGTPAATGTVGEFAGAGIAVGVAEGTTAAFSGAATDAIGNVSACSTPFTYTSDPTGICDKIASPPGSGESTASLYQTAQELEDSLGAGQTGCFRAGTYTFSQTDVVTPNVTLAPYGSDAVTLKGTLKVKPGGAGATIEGMKLNGAGGASNIGPRIYADGVVLRDNEITNDHTDICVSVSSYFSNPAPHGVVIERNRIHDCGVLPSTNLDHGIYVAEARDTVIRDNWIYANADRGIQLYPDAQHTTVTGNVIDGNGEGINFSGHDDQASSDNIVQGNIISDSKLRWNVEDGESGPLPHGNVLQGNCVWASNSKASYNSNGGIQTPSRNFTASGNLVALPAFINAAAGDFHMLWGNGCLAKYVGTLSVPVGPPPPPRTLTVQTQGAGTGTISGPGINCPGDCTETYTNGQQVTLTATPTNGSSLAGWSGACSGTGACQLTMDADKSVSATFNAPPPSRSYTLRPNVDLASGWRVTGASSAWAALDDNLLQPTAPNATDYIQPSAKGQVTTVGLATQALNGAVPQSAVVWYYARTSQTNTKLQLDVRWGGVTRTTYTLPGGQGYAWRWLSLVPPNQAAVDDLNLRFTAVGSVNTVVRAAYVTLTVR